MSNGGGPVQAPAKKAWYRRVPRWGWVAAVAAFLLIGGINNLVNPQQDDPETGSTPAPTAAAFPTTVPTQAPVVEPEPEPTPTVTTPTVSLAETVWAAVQANFPGGITSDSPLFAVTDVEDVSTGTIRAFVQENLADDGREEVARHVFNMGAMENTDLTVVVVRDASRRDSNHYRSDFPYLTQ